MRIFYCTAIFILIFFNNVLSQVLIKNVNVLDVENKKLLRGYNVVALNGHIVSVDKDRMYKLPEGTRVIEGEGKYLVPGFIDAHVHFFQSGGIYARPDAIDLRKIRPYSQEIKWSHDHMEDFLRLYIKAGITSVADVGSTYNFLKQRDSFADKTYAPDISMTGPLLTTYVPGPFKDLNDDGPFIEMKTEEGVKQSVRDQQSHKADFIKIWYIVTGADKEKGARKNLPLVQAAITEAHRLKLRVAVHATERITAQLAVEAGADFLVHNIEDEIVSKEFTDLLRKKKTVLSPTLVVAGNYEKVFGDTYRFTTDELSISHPYTVSTILDYPAPDTSLAKLYIKQMASSTAIALQKHMDSVTQVNIKRMLDAGVIIATGTDAGNTGTQHAGSYFNELKAMQDAGFDRWQLLQASTINAAKAVGKEKSWGSITAGKQANMVLLNANPLDSLSNWRKIDWIINKSAPFRPDSVFIFSPEQLAQQQLNAYNSHDLEAFLEPYAEDVEVYSFPAKLETKGKEKMRATYGFLSRSPTLYCRLLNRIVQGNMVIDHEEILGVPGSPHYGIAIYVIEKGKIKKVYFPD